MTLLQIIYAIPGWIETVFYTLQNAAKDKAATAASAAGAPPLTVLDLLKQERGSFGPSPRTGGVAHRITDDQAVVVATLIEKYGTPPLSPAMMCAWFRGESYFDPLCLNPNFQDAVPNETPEQAFHHTDIGIGQFDGAGLVGMLPGLTWTAAQAKALDPSWAIPQFAKMASGLLAWAAVQDGLLRASGITPPYDTSNTLGFEAYNAGRTGALLRVLNASPAAKAAFAIPSNGGTLVARADAAPADIAFTDQLLLAHPDATLGYGEGLAARTKHYGSLLGSP